MIQTNFEMNVIESCFIVDAIIPENNAKKVCFRNSKIFKFQNVTTILWFNFKKYQDNDKHKIYNILY